VSIADRRSGTTLIEVIAAIAIGAVAILGGVLLMNQVTDTGLRISRDGRASAHEGNSVRTLRRLLREAQPSFDSTKRFRGDARSLDYITRCQMPSGWTEICHVTVSIDSIGDSSAVTAQFDGGNQFVLERHAGLLAFRYFDPVFRDSAWSTRWATSATLPLALGIVSAGDTMVLPVGPSRD
jgi:prepilin-type N-terminal cleavage/methylation domain-containing protein